MRKSKNIVVVAPEEYKRMTSDHIARLLREHRSYCIIRPDNHTNETYIVGRANKS
jgi:hypothetical protein